MTENIVWESLKEDKRREHIKQLGRMASGLDGGQDVERAVNRLLNSWESGCMADADLKYHLCCAVQDFLAYQKGLLEILSDILLASKRDEQEDPMAWESRLVCAEATPQEQPAQTG